MAKLTPTDWECLRADFEIRGMSLSELSEKYGVGKATISDRKKKDALNGDDWLKGKTEHLAEKKANLIIELKETERQTEHLKPNEIEAFNSVVNDLVVARNFFIDSAMMNQKYSNEEIKKSKELGELSIGELKAHSDITAKNKETVLGKQPDTAIQVNNNVSTITDKDEFMQIAAEVLAKV